MIGSSTSETVTIKYKDAFDLKAGTNVYISGITFESSKKEDKAVATKITLGNYGLEFDNCDLSAVNIASVTGGNATGTSSIGFLFDKEAVDDYDEHDGYSAGGKFAITVGSIDKVGTLLIQNVALTVTGKANVGDINTSAYTYYDDRDNIENGNVAHVCVSVPVLR